MTDERLSTVSGLVTASAPFVLLLLIGWEGTLVTWLFAGVATGVYLLWEDWRWDYPLGRPLEWQSVAWFAVLWPAFWTLELLTLGEPQ